MSNLQPLEFNECIIDSPNFREKLLQHEKEIDISYKDFKDIYNSIKNVFKALEGCSNAFIELAENLNKYIHKEDEMCNNTSHAETEDEKTIKAAMTMYSEMISNIELMRKEHILGATKELVFTDLQKLKNDCLAKSKQETKDFRRVTMNYYSKLEKFAATKYKSDGEYKNIDSEIAEDRQQYASKALDYIINIQETEEQKNCKLVHTLSLFIQMLNTYHHQAWDHFGDQKKKVDQINCALYRAEENYSAITERAKTLKQQTLSLPLEQIQPDSVGGTVTRREGYLYVYTKKTVMSDMWTRNFCVYDKSTRKLLITPYNQSSQISVARLQSDEFNIVNCERRKSNTIDRRFCFDIKIENRTTPLTLQALSNDDLQQWLHIMDGKEPIYAKMTNFGNLQEIETTLNEKGLRFLSMCFTMIERKGLETQGIYRISSRAGQCDKVMKKVSEDLRTSQEKDVITEKELDSMDINLLCSIVKAYLKYLRIPMATYELYDDFISAAKLQNVGDKFEAVSKIIKSLPKLNFQLFSIVFRHLKKVTQYEEKNLMTAPNLGVCFSPTIFRPEQVVVSLTAIRDSKFAGDVITLLIEKSDEFFGEPSEPVRPTHLSSSKSMYLNKVSNGDNVLNSDFVRFRLELSQPNSKEVTINNNNNNISSNSTNASPKPNLKGGRTIQKYIDHTSIGRSNTVKPPILIPKPDLSKTPSSPLIISSPVLSPKPLIPRKPDSQKMQSPENIVRKKSLKRAKTLYLYVAENEQQLSFDPNKIVTNVMDSEDNGWIIGTIDGKVGLIPKSYVEMLPS